MKKIFNFLKAIIIGSLAGFALVMIGCLLFTDISPMQFLNSLAAKGFMPVIANCLLSFAALAIAFVLQIIVHEGGHLVGGLLTGYRFVSFRIFTLTLLRRDGRFIVRRFNIPGTGGQCIMLPPDGDAADVPFIIYNAAGVAANILLTAVAAALFFIYIDDSGIFFFLLTLFTAIAGLWTALLNGIPLKINGMCNDAGNIRLMYREPEARRHFIPQLRLHALCQNGMRPKDFPQSWFEGLSHDSGYGLTNAVTDMLAIAREIDKGDYSRARDMLMAIRDRCPTLPDMYDKEIDCEIAFTSLMLGRNDEADRLLTDSLRTYIRHTSSYSSSKPRLLCAVALCLEHDRQKAETILQNLENNRDRYIMLGEVEADICTMRRMLDTANSAIQQHV